MFGGALVRTPLCGSGFAWAGGAAYYRYGCEAAGAHPPFPFALGQLQALSLDAAAALAASRDATEFAAAAEAVPTINANEDSAIGFMMSRVGHVKSASSLMINQR